MIDDFKPKKPTLGKETNLKPLTKRLPLFKGDEKTESISDQPTIALPDKHSSRPAVMADIPVVSPRNSDLESGIETSKLQPPKKSRFKRIFHRPSRRSVLISLVVLLLLGAGGGAAYVRYLYHPKGKFIAEPTTAKKADVPPAPTTVASRLTGVQIDPAVNDQPITGVMIENSPDARPQSGLNKAGVVYEAIAEGGITRFLALFLDDQPTYVGPVRSARPYYLEFLLPYDAGLAHAGGSPDALKYIKQLGVKDLDQFANGNSYQRVASRFAPHNLYSGIDQLIALQKAKGFDNSTNDRGFARKNEQAAAAPTTASIDFNISSFLYNPHFDYDKTTNSYKRSEGGKPHVDERSQEQIHPKVVIAMVMDYKILSDGIHSQYTTTGSGKAYIFQDGTLIEGLWERNDIHAQFRFGDANGAPIALDNGQLWISIVAKSSLVTFK